MSASGRFAQYRVIRELGRGGQGSVYLAEDSNLGRKVALKVLSGVPELSPRSVQRFRREAEITARIDHPGICTTYEFGNEDGTPWIAMRYVEGETLAAKIAAARGANSSAATTTWMSFDSKGLPSSASGARPSSSPTLTSRTPEEVVWVVRVIEQAARALHAAHEQGVVHRDVKPANIMVTPDDTPVILDFGLANVVEGAGPDLTMTGELMGTAHYMAPEQLAKGSIPLDRRADVYALGITLYEALTLTRPFDSPTRQRLYQAILSKDPTDPHHVNPAISRDLSAVVATAIDKDRDRRYQTALDFANDLKRVLDRVPVLARRLGPLPRLARWAQRNPVVAASLAAAFLMLIAGLTATLILLRKANDALVGFERLSDLKRLRDLSAEAQGFWPAVPAKAAAMRAWVARASALVDQIPVHERDLAALGPVAAASAVLSRTEDQWKHDYLTALLGDLRTLADPDPRRGLLADVRQRLAVAETLRANSIDAFAARWDAAAADVATSEKYGKLRFAPQMGLVPLGKSSASALWEFAVLNSGSLPETDGRVASFDFEESTAIVLVLLPGGTFQMGSPPEEGNRDQNEALHEVAVAPFFVGKYEVSQAQWQRITGSNPTAPEPKFPPSHPVENVSWQDCVAACRQLGLALPTEAQWEYACRAGSTTAFTWGNDDAVLENRANVADTSVLKLGRGRSITERVPWDDGFPMHTPVNALAANAFGLYGLHGNVGEWCQDDWAVPTPKLDPAKAPPTYKVYRDGSWMMPPPHARSAARHRTAPETKAPSLGLRVARALDAATPP